MLLNPQANSSADEVGQRIESIFDTATLMAFVRSPDSVNVTITTTNNTPVYIFDLKVLIILPVPLLATVLGTFGRWRMAGNDIYIGYDPVEIARRGPVARLAERKKDPNAAEEDVDEKHVVIVRETAVAEGGSQSMRDYFQVH